MTIRELAQMAVLLITLQVDKVALFVQLELEEDSRIDGQFSENGFVMFEVKKIINFDTNPLITVDILRHILII